MRKKFWLVVTSLSISRFQQARMIHVFWETNKCAEDPVKGGYSQQEDFVFLDVFASVELSSIFSSEAFGLYYVWLFAATLLVLAS